MANAVAQHGIFYRKHYFNALIELAWHPIGAGYIDLFLATVGEIEDAAVLEETAYDASHLDVVADAANSGAQSAHASHQKIDLHSGLGCTVQGSDDVLIEQCIHFRDNSRRAPQTRVVALARDEIQTVLGDVHR